MSFRPLLLPFTCVIAFYGDFLRAQEAPLLRIEAEMHAATIDRISTDASGRLILTVSGDKTARLWSQEPPKSDAGTTRPITTLLRVFRPFVGEVNEGQLYCGALSPDGTIAAVGGWTSAKEGTLFVTHLFDTQTGRLVRSLREESGRIFDMAFSKSGNRLAIGIGTDGQRRFLPGKGGIRVYDAATWTLIGTDTGFKGPCYSLDWHGDERLAAADLDGGARLYELGASRASGDMTPSKVLASIPGGREPFSIRFSPDGARLAVGFDDSTKVAVLDGRTLAFLFAPGTTSLDNGSLSKVAWSADGGTLAAAGSWQRSPGAVAIRLWGAAGKGKPRDVPVSRNTIMDLSPLPDGGFLFAATDPAWGSLPSTGVARHFGWPPLADYRDNWEGFRLSEDGAEVAFGYEVFGGRPHRFSVDDRTLSPIKKSGDFAGLRVPRTKGLPVAQWLDSFKPTLGRRPLELLDNEFSRSLAIAPDDSFFLLGTGFFLRRHEADGQERWRVPVPGVTWAVNLSADGRLAVAAHGDGTIRWHRTDTGRELLAFAPRADQKGWALWTPEGYYDASLGSEDFLGWHLNRGRNQAADFFPVSRFRALYYRPDVISRVLKTHDTGVALTEANAALGLPPSQPESLAEVIGRLSPPVVELHTGGAGRTVTLPAGGDRLTLNYAVRNTGSTPATHVEVRFNGRPLVADAPLPLDGESASLEVELPEGLEGSLAVIASHDLATSEAATLRLRRESVGAPAPPLPDLHLLVVGASKLKLNEGLDTDGDGSVSGAEYAVRHASGDLLFPDLPGIRVDAERVPRCFAREEGRTFGTVRTTVLLDEQATASGVRAAIGHLHSEAKARDVVMVYIAAHGYADARREFFLVTHDMDPARPVETALTGREVGTLLAPIKARVILCLDTCHSGGVFSGSQSHQAVTSPRDLTGLANTLSDAERGIVVITSSSGAEESAESPEGGGFFTQAFVEAMTGKADKSGNAVTCETAGRYVSSRVPEMFREYLAALPAPERKAEEARAREAGRPLSQTPSVILPKGVPDFPLARPE